MGFSYKYLPDIVIADVAFLARGDTPSELFKAAALATAEVMVNPNGIDVVVRKDLAIRAENLEDLLFNWLSELVYVKDVEYLIFSEFDITIVEDKGGHLLTATLGGEEIDPRRHELGQDIKAVTYHLFEIKEVNGRYEARVVLDI